MHTFHLIPATVYATRFVASTALALAVTLALLVVMYQLIAIDVPVLDDVIKPPHSPIMQPPKEPEILKDTREERPADPESPPEWTPTETKIDAREGQLISFTNAPIPVDQQDIDVSGDSGIVAIIRVAPNYPPRAITRGIEGYVDLQFDITASGKTTNIRVIRAEPEGYFEAEAIRTLKKWKYKAPTEGGVPYGQQNMMTRMTFTLEEG